MILYSYHKILPITLIQTNDDSATNSPIVATHCIDVESFNVLVSRVLDSLTTSYSETELRPLIILYFYQIAL